MLLCISLYSEKHNTVSSLFAPCYRRQIPPQHKLFGFGVRKALWFFFTGPYGTYLRMLIEKAETEENPLHHLGYKTTGTAFYNTGRYRF